MKLNEMNVADRPVITVRGNLVPTKVDFSALEGVGEPRNGYGMNVGDVVEFPDTEQDIELMAIPVRENGPKQYVVLVKKNGKQAWFGLSNLRRMDYEMKPVHLVAATLTEQVRAQALPSDDKTRLKLMLGKSITATEAVTYKEAIFEDGTRTNDTRDRTTANLIFGN